MDQRSARHQISNLRRHYGIDGDAMLACYDTAILGLHPYTEVGYVTVSISPTNWKLLCEKVSEETFVKHPGSNVDCIKLFGKLYVRKESRVNDDNVVWAPNLGCYTPTNRYLRESLDRIMMSASSTKKQLAHATKLTDLHIQRLKV